MPAQPLAPEPDFRYVGLEPGPRVDVRAWASILAAGTTLGAGALHGLGARGALLAAMGAVAAALAMRRAGPRVLRRDLAEPREEAEGLESSRYSAHAKKRDAVAMAIVPWGILVQPDSAPRVLRWAAVRRVRVEMIHGRDEGTPTTLWSVVTIETDHERLAGRAPGAVAIERLIAHVDAYAEEQAHPVALDLDGLVAAEGPLEPVIEPLISAARVCLAGGSGADASRLRLPALGYRAGHARAPVTGETLAALRSVLRDRAQRSPDPRALAAVLAAELDAKALASELVALVQSPHPIVAAVAKVAALRLGVGAAKVGAVSEVAPFLHDEDVGALFAWG